MLHRSTVFFPNTYSNSDFPKTKWQNEKRTKEQTTIYKALHIKLKDRVTRTPLNTRGKHRCSRMVSSSCSTSDTRLNSGYAYLVYQERHDHTFKRK